MSSFPVTRSGATWRAIVIAVTGVALAVLVAQTGRAVDRVASTAQGATTRWASCPSVGFYPSDSTESYATEATGRGGQSVAFSCGLSLPHRATITAVRFHLKDSVSFYQIYGCAIVRSRLDPPNDTSQVVASVPDTGTAFEGGYVTKSTTSISHALVDDRAYAYAARCRIPYPNSGILQIVGVSVRYTPAARDTRWASCPGVAFYPRDSADPYSTAGATRRGPSGRLYCGLTLPHGATITAVKFQLNDPNNGADITDCALIRIKLDAPDGTYQTLAGPLASSGFAGYMVRTDTSIDHAVVDDRHYAYLAQCAIPVSDVALGIVGVTIRYTQGATASTWASCPSVAFYPQDGADPYDTVVTGRTGASGRLYCGLSLPQGATITGVRFQLFDEVASSEISDCAIIRIRLDPPDGTYVTVAIVGGSGNIPGYVTKATTTISRPIVNNRSYAYLAQCAVPVLNSELRIIGVTIRYTPG